MAAKGSLVETQPQPAASAPGDGGPRQASRREPAWHRRARRARQQARLLLAAVRSAALLAEHHARPGRRPRSAQASEQAEVEYVEKIVFVPEVKYVEKIVYVPQVVEKVVEKVKYEVVQVPAPPVLASAAAAPRAQSREKELPWWSENRYFDPKDRARMERADRLCSGVSERMEQARERDRQKSLLAELKDSPCLPVEPPAVPPVAAVRESQVLDSGEEPPAVPRGPGPWRSGFILAVEQSDEAHVEAQGAVEVARRVEEAVLQEGQGRPTAASEGGTDRQSHKAGASVPATSMPGPMPSPSVPGVIVLDSDADVPSASDGSDVVSCSSDEPMPSAPADQQKLTFTFMGSDAQRASLIRQFGSLEDAAAVYRQQQLGLSAGHSGEATLEEVDELPEFEAAAQAPGEKSVKVPEVKHCATVVSAPEAKAAQKDPKTPPALPRKLPPRRRLD